ncbi:acyl-CoA thioesterase [Lentibacter sp. XHP0401]|jgi:4-hydroxybenzoyl-CoA thioesterase|uniref:acyl-CoA thioesterase n=1 Tax=Lentibacter sp. XHP0401 TaxID=2984334 RepID=UPI0021E79D40|nr:thioesterase family protein [Lentibacter sp. XHP0401]MCV2894759.1 acyl-CoA thioesterase [Lentibacter sp. XHP0401]
MTFQFRQKVLFKHCDPAGIVFYPRYFEIINDCVEAFFDEVLGWPFEVLLKNGGTPTVQIATEFLAPNRHGDMLVLELTCTKLGRTSMGIEIEARTDGNIRFQVKQTLVCVDASGKPAPWPEAVREALKEKGMIQ